jgi:site-specific DNA recombinase
MARASRNGRGQAALAVETSVRCASYERVSTEAQADKEFSSIDVQRQGCEAYASLHCDEGWTILPERFADPGFTGSNVKRPGLQRLLAAIERGDVDVVIVQRFDRISRSMLDFLQMLQFFKRHGVSFVSVSQRFDTSTPVGEMTLNILLSFAQFERQIIGERTRDKMRAARRRGKWTGGFVPLGYDAAPEGGKIVVNQDEAEQVRAIFDLYTEKMSLIAVAQELTRRGWRRKSWVTRDGKARTGREWNAVDLHRLLTDPLYIGRQKLGDETFDGEHDAIVTKKVFDQVQRILAENNRTSGASNRNRHGALLRGILRCAACDSSMSHAFTERRGKAFRYYRCINAIKNGKDACPTGSVPAVKIEAFVVEQIKKIGSDPALRDETFRQVQAQIATERRGLKAETKRIARELAILRAELGQLTTAVTRATGPAADALLAKLADFQERATTLERRQREIADRLVALDAQDVDPEAVGRALVQFTELWDVLLAPERERVVRLLIEQVRYDGASGTLQFRFAPAGFSLLAADLAPAESES